MLKCKRLAQRTGEKQMVSQTCSRGAPTRGGRGIRLRSCEKILKNYLSIAAAAVMFHVHYGPLVVADGGVSRFAKLLSVSLDFFWFSGAGIVL